MVGQLARPPCHIGPTRKGKEMATILKRIVPAVMALGMALGASAGAANASTHSSAKTTTTVAHTATTKTHRSTPARTAKTIKAGSPCTKAMLGKSRSVGKVQLTCEKVGKAYKWEVTKPAKKLGKK